MIFAILFVVAFIIGLIAYLVTGKWLSAACISMGLFALNAFSGSASTKQLGVTLLLGLPVVFAASIFGAYVVELRRGLGVDEIMDAPDQERDGDESSEQSQHRADSKLD